MSRKGEVCLLIGTSVEVILYIGTVEVVIFKDNFFHLAAIPKVLSNQMHRYTTTVCFANLAFMSCVFYFVVQICF